MMEYLKWKEKKFVSAVIYVHNAEAYIEAFLRAVMDVLQNSFEHSEIICINDASSDRSLERIRSAGTGDGEAVSVSVVNMGCFHGKEAAMNAGTDLAIGDFVFQFDNAQLDFDRSVILDVYHRSLQGADIVSASADCRERFSSRLFYRVFGCFADMQDRLESESFRILSRRAINRACSMEGAFLYRKAVYAACGLKTVHVRYPVCGTHKRDYSPQEARCRFRLAADSLILFTELGYRFSMAMTAVMMFLSIGMAAYSLVTYLVMKPVEGWTTTILFLSAAFFGLFGVLTVIIKYLQLLSGMAFKKNRYGFESIEKLTGQGRES